VFIYLNMLLMVLVFRQIFKPLMKPGMDISHTLQECRIDSVLESIGIKSLSAKDLFKAQAARWTTNPDTLRARSEGWRRLKALNSAEWDTHLPALLENEALIREIDPATASASQKEDWSQILFTGEWSSLNHIPFLLIYVAMSKIFLAPLIAWVMPFLSLVIPFFALKYVYNLPITWEQYWESVKPMLFGASRGGAKSDIMSLIQWGGLIVSYGHGMYLPYTNAVHCYKIDQLMIKGSKAIVDTVKRLRAIADIWVSYGLKKPWSFPDPAFYGDDRQVLAWITEDKTLLPEIYRAIGRVEITAAVTKERGLVPVEWEQTGTPFCRMVGAVDSLLPVDKRIPFNLIMGPTEHHAICTGPNRGGKSTFLRSALTNIVFAQALGVAFAKRCIMTPVEWVISSLRLEDRPGQESLFEREVSVAGEILRRVRLGDTRGWVIIDELFHTTNPPDAATASQIFLQQLWASERVTSIVSTHLFTHAATAPYNVQRLCVDSDIFESGKIHYKYEVMRGINMMSSVEELLVESGVAAFSSEAKTSPADIE
jgi:hypothetical protein